MITVLVWLAIGSLLMVVPTAIAARVLHEFSRFELEGYCRRHNRPGLFDEVLDHHEKFALGAEAFQWIGTVLFLSAGTVWYLGTHTAIQQVILAGEPLTYPVAAPLILWILGLIVLMIFVNSWVPWAVVQLASAPFLFHTWWIWKFVSRLAFPMAIGYSIIQFVAHRMAGRQEDDEDAEEEALEEEIRTIVTAGEREGLLESPAREMIEGVINLDDIDVGDIMTPRSRMRALNIALPPEELVREAIAHGFTRIPIYEDRLENIIGILFVKDLLPILLDGNIQDADIRKLLRPPQYVPISIHSDDLLQRFRESRSHLSVVVDEYHSVVGVVTIEDVLEEIVGEITDETDGDETPQFYWIDSRTAQAMASARIDELNEELKLDLPESDEFDTLGGLVLTRFERIPSVGEWLVEGNVRIVVEKANRRAVEILRLEILDDAEKNKDNASSKAVHGS